MVFSSSLDSKHINFNLKQKISYGLAKKFLNNKKMALNYKILLSLWNDNIWLILLMSIYFENIKKIIDYFLIFRRFLRERRLSGWRLPSHARVSLDGRRHSRPRTHGRTLRVKTTLWWSKKAPQWRHNNLSSHLY